MSLNPNPVVYAVKPTVKRRRHDNGDLLHLGDSLVTSVDVDDADLAAADARDAVDAAEVFELIRHLADPEHPLTLEQLHVVRAEHIHVEVRFFLFVSRHVTTRLQRSLLVIVRIKKIIFLCNSRRPFRTARWQRSSACACASNCIARCRRDSRQAAKCLLVFFRFRN
jgi:hypothetical protein